MLPRLVLELGSPQMGRSQRERTLRVKDHHLAIHHLSMALARYYQPLLVMRKARRGGDALRLPQSLPR